MEKWKKGMGGGDWRWHGGWAGVTFASKNWAGEGGINQHPGVLRHPRASKIQRCVQSPVLGVQRFPSVR